MRLNVQVYCVLVFNWHKKKCVCVMISAIAGGQLPVQLAVYGEALTLAAVRRTLSNYM